MPSVPSAVGRLDISGDPDEDEVAAILAAIEQVWPKPQPLREPKPADTTWRHSGRWWNQGRLPTRWT